MSIGERFEAARVGRGERREHRSQRAHPLSLRPDPRFRRLVGAEQFAGEALADRPGHEFHQRAGRACMTVHAETQADAERLQKRREGATRRDEDSTSSRAAQPGDPSRVGRSKRECRLT
jgi:hypothetical protein